MNTMRIMPEGWNNEVTKLNQTNVKQYMIEKNNKVKDNNERFKRDKSRN